MSLGHGKMARAQEPQPTQGMHNSGPHPGWTMSQPPMWEGWIVVVKFQRACLGNDVKNDGRLNRGTQPRLEWRVGIYV